MPALRVRMPGACYDAALPEQTRHRSLRRRGNRRHAILPDQLAATAEATPGIAPQPPRWHRFVAWLLRNFYFRVRVVGAPVASRPRQLILSSHRNGAIDGYLVLAAFPDANFLVSVQLLRSRLLRLMFTGIPVVRDKDTQRYGLKKRQFGNPVSAAMACFAAGGSLVIFPEGSSDWGPKPLPYEPGAARIVRMALADGLPIEVVPVGLFYPAPDRFRSRAEVLVGEPVVLPAQGERERRAWEAEIGALLASALDAVSVNCPDRDVFERVERLAAADSGDGGSYALAFKAREAQARAGTLGAGADPRRVPSRYPWDWLGMAILALVLAPVLLVGYAAGRKADARNTTTFFRMAGGLAVALFWLPVLLLLAIAVPKVMLPAAGLAAFGWWRWPES
jgi:1-acyl-sn-glycerol-3-phosphate acyltransferase